MSGSRKRLFLFTLWYFPTHFGLHVDDVARAFVEAGYEVTIVTLEESAFAHSYFDPFRGLFTRGANGCQRVIRLGLARLETRGALNPHIFLRDGGVLNEASHEMHASPCILLHYFEMMLPFFNRETIQTASACAVMYAGNFLRRIAEHEREPASSGASGDHVARELLARVRIDYPDGHYALRGTDAVLSETKELTRMLRATELRTPVFWTSRPIFAAPIRAARTLDLTAAFGIPKRANVLLYAGRPDKNAAALPTILRFVRRRRPCDCIFLLLIGVSREAVCKWPGARDQMARIVARPFVPRVVLFSIMKAVNVLVYPGLVDGYPKVVSEAGLARLPVVAFDSVASGLREIEKDEGSALLVPAASASGTSTKENARFAGAVDRLLDDPALRDRLTANALRRARRMDAHHFVARIERSWTIGR